MYNVHLTQISNKLKQERIILQPLPVLLIPFNELAELVDCDSKTYLKHRDSFGKENL